jgi:replicative DNA helicase
LTDGIIEDDLLDRLPPYNAEAERGLLGSVLIDDSVFDEASAIVKEDDFFRSAHQVYWRAFVKLKAAGKPIDAITIADQLIEDGEYDAAGGDDTLQDILASVPHAANGKYYAGIVHEKAVTRRLIGVANTILSKSYSGEHTSEELVSEAYQSITGLGDDGHGDSTSDSDGGTEEELDRAISRILAGRPTRGLPTGFPGVDRATLGMHSGQLIILAGRPASGKTSLGVNIAASAAFDTGATTLMFSLEMSKDEIWHRVTASRTGVSGTDLMMGRAKAHEIAIVGEFKNRIRGSKFFVNERAAVKVSDMAAEARRIQAKHGLDLIVVDHLLIVEPDRPGGKQYEAITKISKDLKRLAKTMKVPVLALCQLNRAGQGDEDKRPKMHHLRDSGAIEQDADVVMLLHREDYYDPDKDPGCAELIIAKNRNGPDCTVNLRFIRHCTAFASLVDETDQILV